MDVHVQKQAGSFLTRRYRQRLPIFLRKSLECSGPECPFEDPVNTRSVRPVYTIAVLQLQRILNHAHSKDRSVQFLGFHASLGYIVLYYCYML